MVLLLAHVDDRQNDRNCCGGSLTSSCRIDVIITVFNALYFVQKNLERLEQVTEGGMAAFIIINDGSNGIVSDWLVDFTKRKNAYRLAEFQTSKGYTKAINFGVRTSLGEFLVVMNSDVLLSVGWLNGMMECMCSNSKVGIVGPLSNAGGFQNVPLLFNKKRDFALNEIPRGWTIDDVSSAITGFSAGTCMAVEVVNGFCYLVRKAVFDVIGYYDADRFSEGYGEEDDFCMRASAAGYSLVVTDAVYVYHFKSRSFGTARRSTLARQGFLANMEKHSRRRVMSLWKNMSRLSSLQQVRARVCREVYDSKGC